MLSKTTKNIVAAMVGCAELGEMDVLKEMLERMIQSHGDEALSIVRLADLVYLYNQIDSYVEHQTHFPEVKLLLRAYQ